MKVLFSLILLLGGLGSGFYANKLLSPNLEGTGVTPKEIVLAINEDRRSITLLSNSLVEVIKRLNEVAPAEKKFPEYKK